MLENEYTPDAPEQTPTRRVRHSRRFDAGSIFVALLVLTAGGGLYYMHWRTAEALKLVQRADADAASVETFLSGGRTSLVSLGKAIHDTRATVARLTRTEEPVGASVLFDPRDPFRFESLEPTNIASALSATGNSAREQARAQLLTKARTLQVQSILLGSSRRSCLINGKLYFEGQSCGDFTVDSIVKDAVIIQGGEFRFELRFRK